MLIFYKFNKIYNIFIIKIGCWYLGRKDLMYMKLSKAKRRFPEAYDFIPRTFLLSSEWERFVAIVEEGETSKLWILKPVASACGRGIKVINKTKLNMNKKKMY
jgi:hypothetical protein